MKCDKNKIFFTRILLYLRCNHETNICHPIFDVFCTGCFESGSTVFFGQMASCGRIFAASKEGLFA